MAGGRRTQPQPRRGGAATPAGRRASAEARCGERAHEAAQDAYLASLPDGARVAVVTMVGSLCPVTLGHVECFAEARRILLGEPPRADPSWGRPEGLERFDGVVGLAALNGDGHVAAKVSAKGQRPLCREDRAHLFRLSTAELPWLRLGIGAARELPHRFPRLRFTAFSMNGADDVAKYRKWGHTGKDRRMLVIGRPGYTAKVCDGMRRDRVQPGPHCIVTPELADFSSTEARAHSQRGRAAGLCRLLHPAAAAWMLRNDGHPEEADAVSAGTAGMSAAPPGCAELPGELPAEA